MTTTPTISIVLPTFNGATYVRESVESCLAQTFEDLEIIAVIDGSTDETEQILRSYSDPRLRIHFQANQGLPDALNAGFSLARGRFFSWTSDDNIYFPQAFAVMLRYLEEHPATAMACTDLFVIDGSGKTVSYSDNVWACFLYRAEAAALAGPYRSEFPLVEDIDFFLRLRHSAGAIDRIKHPYYKYRQHKSSLSSRYIGKRQLVSLKLHCDLVARGVEQLDLKDLFWDRLSTAALYRDYQTMNAIVDFAREQGQPFKDVLQAHSCLLKTRSGWLWNRLEIAVKSQRDKLRRSYLLFRTEHVRSVEEA